MFHFQDYKYFCIEDNRNVLEEQISKLEKHASKALIEKFLRLSREKHYEELVESLIINYYDVVYKKPRGVPLETFQVSKGALLNQTFLDSGLVTDLIKFGQHYHEKNNKLSVN